MPKDENGNRSSRVFDIFASIDVINSHVGEAAIPLCFNVLIC